MFRPCIDLHQGRVKQLVGGSYTDSGEGLQTRFVSERDAAWYATLFQKDGLQGGHVIMIGPGNEDEALKALNTYPGGLQIGGGIHDGNAVHFLDQGASHVIVTSWLFPENELALDRVRLLSHLTGRERLVIDLSCRKQGGVYRVVTKRWQEFTRQILDRELLQTLEPYADEFLIHAVDVEGRAEGVDWELVENLITWSARPLTYAGGAKSLDDLERIQQIGGGRVHLTIGAALDIFGGRGVAYSDAVLFNRRVGDEQSGGR